MTTPSPVALVILPFPDKESAETFVALVHGSTQGVAQPMVTAGLMYEYETSGNRSQAVEFHGTWEGFDLPPSTPGAVVIRPITEEQP